MEFKKSFEPIVDDNSKILILGSLPSDKSIMANEYYGHRNNHFWKILIAVFNGTLEDIKTYENKKQFLHKNHIAVWDVYRKANRDGSEDKNIVNGEFNDIKGLLLQYPNIKFILANGKKAFNSFKKYAKRENLKYDYVYVPSSSSLNASYSFEEKVEKWRTAVETSGIDKV